MTLSLFGLHTNILGYPDYSFTPRIPVPEKPTRKKDTPSKRRGNKAVRKTG